MIVCRRSAHAVAYVMASTLKSTLKSGLVAMPVQVIIIEAEVMAQFVQHGSSDLSNQLFPAVAHPFMGPFEDGDDIGKSTRIPPAAPRKRNALIESQKIPGGGGASCQLSLIRFIGDGYHDIIQGLEEALGQTCQGVVHGGFEFLIIDMHLRLPRDSLFLQRYANHRYARSASRPAFGAKRITGIPFAMMGDWVFSISHNRTSGRR